MFLAPTRHPVMHNPQKVQACREGPAPPKKGSGPEAEKSTPTGVTAGRVVTNWPGNAAEYHRRTARLNPADYT